MSQYGTSLLEVLVAAALATLLAAAAWTASQGSRMLEAHAAAGQFDALLAYGRALASSGGNGATIAFTPEGSQVRLTLYSGRPNGAPVLAAPIPPLVVGVSVSESALGAPPFSIFIDGAGYASGEAAYPAASATPWPSISAEPSCPPAGAYTVSFSAGPAVETRRLACPAEAVGSPAP
jgi:hypothetical protein